MGNTYDTSLNKLLNLIVTLGWLGVLLKALFWIGVIVAIVLTVRALMTMAKLQREISASL